MVYAATFTCQRFAPLDVLDESFLELGRDVPEDSQPYKQCFTLTLKIMTVHRYVGGQSDHCSYVPLPQQ